MLRGRAEILQKVVIKGHAEKMPFKGLAHGRHS